MSVLMTMRLSGDPARVEQAMAENPDEGRAIVEEAKQHGLIAHRFYGSDDGQIMVADEWPDASSFQQFMQAAGGRIQTLMDAVGAQVTAEPSFWRELDTSDKFGWE